MNAATLEMMERVIQQIRPMQSDWQWVGKNRRDVRKGLTYNEARVLQLQHGGEIEKA